MPKRVDQEERRRYIAEAVLRLLAAGGLDAVSLRDVAAEAGVSMGMVQHYFASKDRMLTFACEYLVERTRERIQEEFGSRSSPPSARELLRQVYLQMLPLDDERRAGIRVWFAFLARAVVEPELEAFMRATWTGSHRFFASIIESGREQGGISRAIDPGREAIRARSLVDGLVPHVLLGHYTEDAALAAIDSYLEELFSR
ncbi:MAG TPA: TetR family transcriptional regulator C-terminal domain-containing protein [Thermomicrobiaceae bacterium]|nr:TetR family transcriptional regulator C-terminal domain-containing protein [Thermomicrobiaceae bacterium]